MTPKMPKDDCISTIEDAIEFLVSELMKNEMYRDLLTVLFATNSQEEIERTVKEIWKVKAKNLDETALNKLTQQVYATVVSFYITQKVLELETNGENEKTEQQVLYQ